MNILCGGQSVRLRPHLLGAGLLLGAVLEVLRASGIDWTREDGSLALAFNQWTAVALIALAVGWCASWIAGILRDGTTQRLCGTERRTLLRDSSVSAPTALAATTALLLTGCYVSGAPLLAMPLSYASMVVTGIAFAFGIASCAALWFRVYGNLDPADSLVHATLCIGIAGIVRFIMSSHDPIATLLVFAACCLASYAGLIASLSTNTAEPDAASDERDEASEDGNANAETARIAAKSALHILWLPLAALSIVGFIQGLVWNPVVSQTAIAGPLNIQALDVPIGGLAACGAVIIALRLMPSELRCQSIADGGVPIAMGILLLYPVVIPQETVINDLLGWLPQLGFALIVLFSWQSLMLAQRASRASGAPVLALGLLLAALSYAVGLTLIHVIGTGGRDLCLVLLTIYLVLFCIFLAQETRTEQQGRTSDELRPDTFIHRRCDELAREHGISPRETEVLYLLGRGYNHAYIARKLFVSENTVRTHVRHIYGKLGLSSREELLDLIDEGAS